MGIAEYLEKRGLTQGQFAEIVGVSPGLVWQWINGYTRITAEKAVEIETKTRKQVKRRELRPDLFGSARKRGSGVT